MKMYSVDQVADTLLDLGRKSGIEISNLKLQKLVYYAQAWHLVFERRPLFSESIEAWMHGPVVPELFRRFRKFGASQITEQGNPVNDAELRRFLSKVLHAYGNYGAFQLEELTHREDPWKIARGGLPARAASNEVILESNMRAYYSRRVHARSQKA